MDLIDVEVSELMAEFEDPGSDRLRLTERDILIQVREALRYIKVELAAHQKELDGKSTIEASKDHENRLRILENFRWWILGAIAASSILGGLVAKHLPF